MNGQPGRLRLADVRFLDEAWPREALDRDRVAEFRALYEAEGPLALPPIEVVHARQFGGYLLVDGWHRTEALSELEAEETLVVFLAAPEGEAPEALAYRRGLETSARTSKPLSRHEKQLAIVRLLHERPGESDRAIARLVGVDHKTVGRIRERGISPNSGATPRPPSASDQARRLLLAFEKAYETRGLGVADFFLGERSGERFAEVFRESYGDEALPWATAMRNWLDAAVESLEIEAEAEE